MIAGRAWRRLAWALSVHGGRRLGWIDAGSGALAGLLWPTGSASRWPVVMQASAVVLAAAAGGLYERFAWTGHRRLLGRASAAAVAGTVLGGAILWVATPTGSAPLSVGSALAVLGLTVVLLAGPRLLLAGVLGQWPLRIHAPDPEVAACLDRALQATGVRLWTVDSSGRGRGTRPPRDPARGS